MADITFYGLNANFGITDGQRGHENILYFGLNANFEINDGWRGYENVIYFGLNANFEDTTGVYDPDCAQFLGLSAEFDGTTIGAETICFDGIIAEYDGTISNPSYIEFHATTGEFQEPNYLPVENPDLSIASGTQQTGVGYEEGRMSISVTWDIPSASEYLPGEFIGIATGSTDIFALKHRNIQEPTGFSLQTYEVTSETGTYEDITDSAEVGDIYLTVSSPSTFSENDWVKIENDPGWAIEYNRIVDIDSTCVELEYPITIALPANTLILRKINASLKTKTTDYSYDSTAGTVTTVSGKFTNGNDVFVRYKFSNDSIDHYEIYRVQGINPLDNRSMYDEVISYPGIITLESNYDSTNASYNNILTTSQNGESFTYYIFAIDTDGNPSLASRLFIETIPSRPENLDDISTDFEIRFSWNAISESNIDGYNIYRCIGTWNPANAIKMNSILVTDAYFTDGPTNTTNRVSSVTAPYPEPEQLYSYRIEAQDTVTTWDIGTQNQSSGLPEVSTSTKNV